MKKFLILTALITLASLNLFSQSVSGPKQPGPTKASAAESSALDLAAAAVAAHGGDKFKQMRSIAVNGSVSITGAFSQVIPATFMMVISGDRYVFELNNPFQPLKQISDGSTKYSAGYELPPITSLGFPLLVKVGDAGYVTSPLVDVKKKRKGFRVTTPEGFSTDFTINEKTGQISGYESSYDVGGRIVTTSVEIDEFQMVDGVVVPSKYSQRFDLGQVTAYAKFKTKEIRVNSVIADDVFAIPK